LVSSIRHDLRLEASAAMLWPPSTNRTASCLNPSVKRALVVFIKTARDLTGAVRGQVEQDGDV
jgi:hypothetical protein